MKMDAHQEKMIGQTYFIVGYFSNSVSKQKLEIISTLLSLFIFLLRKLHLIRGSFVLLRVIHIIFFLWPFVTYHILQIGTLWNLFSSIHCVYLTQKQIGTYLSVFSALHFYLFSYNLSWYNKGIVEKDIYIYCSPPIVWGWVRIVYIIMTSEGRRNISEHEKL